MTPEQEIEALVHLIDDPDDQIYTQIRSKIISYGLDAVPKLEHAWEVETFGATFQKRIEEIIHEIQIRDICYALESWKSDGAKSLLEGVFHINRYKYPEISIKTFEDILDQLKRDAMIELTGNMTPEAQIKALNHIIFDVHRYSGDRENYHSSGNSFFNQLIAMKRGNPLMLSILYMEVAQRLGIPIKGINLPNHFVVAYVNSIESEDILEPGSEVEFYINPFSRGAIFSRADIDDFLDRLKLTPKMKYYLPCSNIDIIKRLIANLMFSYSKEDKPEKVDELQKILSYL